MHRFHFPHLSSLEEPETTEWSNKVSLSLGSYTLSVCNESDYRIRYPGQLTLSVAVCSNEFSMFIWSESYHVWKDNK
ncbi:hypothetical protein X798_05241 [Onchocerca flexuosa]|uniref:Uncharacterized protein n=1 Tax=Onchocerca flexuosa TaxID=387005 RepID=A0A238BR83_9BILA|nr:hypothetical protein X798_05241 [Onchocerca flexuosa]